MKTGNLYGTRVCFILAMLCAMTIFFLRGLTMYKISIIFSVFSLILVGHLAAAPSPDIVEPDTICSCVSGQWSPPPCTLPGDFSCPRGEGDIIEILQSRFRKDGSLTKENARFVKYIYLGDYDYAICKPVRSRKKSGCQILAVTKVRS
jgi:hypothetical protein